MRPPTGQRNGSPDMTGALDRGHRTAGRLRREDATSAVSRRSRPRKNATTGTDAAESHPRLPRPSDGPGSPIGLAACELPRVCRPAFAPRPPSHC
ncbi:hypothetical protein MPTK1_6g02300 [Marchantia polymorpha subsp. ruderalis]|uniref:Uncharacterized protein n=2 Tax=Marchantia polymorpha TaxID=3197 RepID=A0AAF6BMP4_MARPO|nr:hypothetical protein MARPO_0035s0015 [Marchantia polymorpha]BBN13278.1 hypothetical protein Mp_6g02300 [Marchantia polymorpha subsp. ruderalis]|eukprot:PTQ41204.1 hypothetical protein MARPO_0035s0015 [Marchantia polymorpha]